MTSGYFVTGTDTGVGKTLIACALLHQLRRAGLRAVGMKPVAAGCTRAGDALINEDVQALQAAGTPLPNGESISVYVFGEPIAPHLAAAHTGASIDLNRIEQRYLALRRHADALVVEGAGGFLVPLNERESFADLAERLALPVVLVVGMRLGCLNHALLTVEAVRRRGLELAGWVANQIDPAMARLEENVASLEQRLDSPLLARVPYQSMPDPALLTMALPSVR